MIVCMLREMSRYRGLSKNLDIAFDWLSQKSWKTLAAGKHPIQGDEVFALVQEYATKDPAVCRFETHKKYIDIQMIVEGEEIIEAMPAEFLKSAEPYVTDIEYYSAPAGHNAHPLAMVPECCAVFFPEDAHRPGLRIGGEARQVKKIVVKVSV